MAQASGVALQRSSSSGSLSRTRLRLAELAGLFCLGAVAVMVHAATRDQLNLQPGHEGMIWIAMLLIGRTTSKNRTAGMTVALGAASVSMLPVWGFGDPYRWFEYMLVGSVVDVAYLALSRWNRKLWLLVLVGALAFMLKPFARVEIDILTGWPYGSLLYGVAYPAATHFIFGAIGAFLGAGAVLGVKRFTSQSNRLR